MDYLVDAVWVLPAQHTVDDAAGESRSSEENSQTMSAGPANPSHRQSDAILLQFSKKYQTAYPRDQLVTWQSKWVISLGLRLSGDSLLKSPRDNGALHLSTENRLEHMMRIADWDKCWLNHLLI